MLALANGDPLVVEEPVHRGRVVLVATSAEPSWTAMPLWPSFVPLVQEIVAWCAAGQLQQRNVAVGEPLDALDRRAGRRRAARACRRPTAARTRRSCTPTGDYCALSYADTMQSGIYAVRFGPPVDRSQTFAVNVDTAESDLAQIDAEELRSEVWPGVPFVHQTSWQDLGATGPAARSAAEAACTSICSTRCWDCCSSKRSWPGDRTSAVEMGLATRNRGTMADAVLRRH